MVEETQLKRPRGSYPGVYGEYSFTPEIISDLAEHIVADQILALRIADQPPYGFIFRVDRLGLVRKVWRAKGRVDEFGNVDLVKKPVTSLSDKQSKEHIDWNMLESLGFTESKIEKILGLSIHTVLPVNDSIPDHLITKNDHVPTISTIKFPEETHFYKLVEEVSTWDTDAIVGGTSLNPEGRPAYIDSEQLLVKTGGINSIADFVILSENREDSDSELQHAMVSLVNGGVEFLRKGIGYQTAVNKLKEDGIPVLD